MLRKRHRPVCRFCADLQLDIDYKNTAMLRNFVTERFKIVPARQSRLCAWHQRKVRQAIKRARVMALLPYTVNKGLPRDVLAG